MGFIRERPAHWPRGTLAVGPYSHKGLVPAQVERIRSLGVYIVHHPIIRWILYKQISTCDRTNHEKIVPVTNLRIPQYHTHKPSFSCDPSTHNPANFFDDPKQSTRLRPPEYTVDRAPSSCCELMRSRHESLTILAFCIP